MHARQSHTGKKNLTPLVLWVAAVSAAVDQLIKWWALGLFEQKASVSVIDGVLRLRRTENTGAVFGIFQGTTDLLTILSLVILASIFYPLYRMQKTSYMGISAKLGLGLIIGGTGANLCDRIRRGSVLDFFDLYGLHADIGTTRVSVPTFNVADICIILGTIMVVASLFLTKDQRTNNPTQGTLR